MFFLNRKTLKEIIHLQKMSASLSFFGDHIDIDRELCIGSIIRVNPGNRTFVIDSIFKDPLKYKIVIKASNEIDKNFAFYIVRIEGKWYSEFQGEYEIVFEQHSEDFHEQREFRLIDLVRKHRDKNWNWSWISSNPNITAEDIEEDLSRNDPLPWDLEEIQKNPNINHEFIEAHLNDDRWKWDWEVISMNPNITPEFIEVHLDEDWKWNWEFISMNPNITPEFIGYHLDEDWNWYYISMNPNITPEFIEAHFDDSRWKWDWRTITRNPNITPEFIGAHLDDDRWGWDFLISRNPNITLEFIEAHLDDDRWKWDWYWLSRNEFGWKNPRYQTLIKPARS